MKLSTSTLCMLFVMSAPNQLPAQPSTVQWMDDSEAGVAAAQKSSLPILFLVLPKAGEPSTTAQKSIESFNNKAVIRWVTQRFIAVQLPQSTTAEVLLRRLDAPNAADGSAVIATPGGSGIGIIATDDVQDAQRLVKKLAETFKNYQTKVLADSVTPVLANGDAKTDDLLKSIRLVQDLELLEADKAIVELLDREELKDAVRSAAYDALAGLSTKRAVVKLLDAALKDKNAVQALHLCTPAGAAVLVDDLKLDERERLIAAYDALITICSIGQAKPEEFWKSGDKASQVTEMDRIKVEVSTCVQSWRKSRE